MSLDSSQIQFITEIKEKVRAAQYEALKAYNTFTQSLLGAWKGNFRKASKRLGEISIVSTLSSELQSEFPAMSGFSVANLWLISQFYTEYSLDESLVPLVREIS